MKSRRKLPSWIRWPLTCPISRKWPAMWRWCKSMSRAWVICTAGKLAYIVLCFVRLCFALVETSDLWFVRVSTIQDELTFSATCTEVANKVRIFVRCWWTCDVWLQWTGGKNQVQACWIFRGPQRDSQVIPASFCMFFEYRFQLCCGTARGYNAGLWVMWMGNFFEQC